MGKFKTGDWIQFKSEEELKKIAFFDVWEPKYKVLAGKVVRVYKPYGDNHCFIQDGQEILKPIFPECYFEDLKDTLLLVES